LSSKSTFSSSTSRSYSLALYEICKENSELDSVEGNMKSLNELLNLSTDLKGIILNPAIRKEEKKNIILKIAEKNNFSKSLKLFLGYVAIKNRLFFLEKIIKSFLNLVSKKKGELKAKLISAKNLSIEEQKKIQRDLSENFKSQLKIDYSYQPDLIAGLIIQVGSIMVDTSVKTKLKKLENNLVEA
jgi:F-type H+-transporting ATPase subunit delta|tara:strand:- start:424 stop:981 length:558 start_codon:yes stop_codon:yes gene_type:complete